MRTDTVPTPAPRPSRYAHLPRIFARAALIFVPAVLLVTLLTVKLLRYRAADESFVSVDSQLSAAEQPVELSAASQSQRPVFPYSIVSGGVRDARELQSAASHDPVVASHYSDFRIASARSMRLDHPLEMYVSYRRHNQVYWTRNRLVIPAGETLLSDGSNLARVRCGNRLSAIAMKPVSVTEPSKEELDAPEFVPPLMADLLPGERGDYFPGAPAALPPSPNSGTGPHTPGPAVFPPLLPPGVRSQFPTIVPPPPVSTPEPSTLALLFSGVALVALLLGFLRRNGSS